MELNSDAGTRRVTPLNSTGDSNTCRRVVFLHQSNDYDSAHVDDGIKLRSSSRISMTTAASTTTDRDNQATSNNKVRGRKVYRRCIYFLVLGLGVVVVLNLGLTLWLLKVLDFGLEGIGSLKVVPGGLELRGQAVILDELVASSLRSRKGSNLLLES